MPSEPSTPRTRASFKHTFRRRGRVHSGYRIHSYLPHSIAILITLCRTSALCQGGRRVPTWLTLVRKWHEILAGAEYYKPY